MKYALSLNLIGKCDKMWKNVLFVIFKVFLVHPAAIGGLFPSHPQPIANSSLTQTKVILFNKFFNLFNKIRILLSSAVIHALETLVCLNVYGVIYSYTSNIYHGKNRWCLKNGSLPLYKGYFQ